MFLDFLRESYESDVRTLVFVLIPCGKNTGKVTKSKKGWHMLKGLLSTTCVKAPLGSCSSGILSHQPLRGPSHDQRAAPWSSAGWLAPKDTARVLADGSCVCAVTGVSTLERDAAVFQEVFQREGAWSSGVDGSSGGRWGLSSVKHCLLLSRHACQRQQGQE